MVALLVSEEARTRNVSPGEPLSRVRPHVPITVAAEARARVSRVPVGGSGGNRYQLLQ